MKTLKKNKSRAARGLRPCLVAGAVAAACVTTTVAGQTVPKTEPPSLSSTQRHVGQREDLKDLTLVRADEANAVVRFGTGALEMISVGDRLGRNNAEVKEISAGRLVIEETFTGKDRRPNRAQIILREGETGGKRYLLRPDEPPPTASRPQVIVPAAQDAKTKAPPKKPRPPGGEAA